MLDPRLPSASTRVLRQCLLVTTPPGVNLLRRLRRRDTRYSDKKRVAHFRTYAADLYEKQGVANKVHKLIGDLVLDDTLAELGREAREADEAAGWDACHWRPNAQAGVSTLHGEIDEAMRLLDEFATLADTGFQSTHGKSQRRRDPGSSRSKKQFGMGWSQQAVDTARRIVTIRGGQLSDGQRRRGLSGDCHRDG